jgi:hypothetical protein
MILGSMGGTATSPATAVKVQPTSTHSPTHPETHRAIIILSLDLSDACKVAIVTPAYKL